MKADAATRLRARTLVLGLLLLGVRPLVAAEPRPAPAAGGDELVLHHGWASASELEAIGALVDLYRQKYPDVKVTVVPSPNSGIAMFGVVSNLARNHRPPDSFQMDTGYASQPFYDAGLVDPLDDLWESEQLEKVIPRTVGEISRIGGHYYAVPVDVHRMNVVWCNKRLLDKYKIRASTLTTWDAFFKAAETLRAGGVRDPIRLGETWTLSQVLEGIMVSSGIAVYEDWVNGKIRSGGDPRLRAALETLAQYLRYTNANHAELGWEQEVHGVITGDSAFCIMGDWANGEFKVAGLKYGVDYEAIPVPGTKGLYGINVDGFQRPHGRLHEASASKWLKLVVSREGQDAFNPPKGSISPRSDADASRYDAYQRAALADFKTAKVYPTLGQATPPAFGDELDRVLTAFSTNPDVAKTAAAMAATTSKLASKYTRVWSLK